MTQNSKNAILLQDLRKKRVMKMIFCMQISMKISYNLILWFSWCWSTILKVPKIASLQCLYNISKKVKDKVDFFHADKHQSLLQVVFNTFGITVSYKEVLYVLMDITKHSQSTQSKKFVISLKYRKKEVKDGVHILHADKHQAF